MKFVLPTAAARDLVLKLCGDDYVALGPFDTYRTVYFDTAALALYHAHRCGRRVRHKVRIRHYPDRPSSFLEVKTRISELQTVKARLEHPVGDSALAPDDVAFVHAHTRFLPELQPRVWTAFRRLTLLGLHTNERVTVDVDLLVTAPERTEGLPNTAVVEVKQSPFRRRTKVLLALRAAGWRHGFASKYCTAIALTHPDVPRGRLVPGLRVLERMAS